MEEATESNPKPERKGEGAASAALPHFALSNYGHTFQTYNYLNIHANTEFTMKFSTNTVLIHEEKMVCVMMMDSTVYLKIESIHFRSLTSQILWDQLVDHLDSF